MNCQIFLLSILVFFNVAWEISAGEAEWRNAIKSEVNKCRYHMSEETAAIFDDDEEYDNEEVRKFLACLYKSLSYMVNGAINLNKLDIAIDRYFVEDPQTASSLHNIVKFCKQYEVDENDTEVDVAGKFTNCLNSHKKTDVEPIDIYSPKTNQ